MENNKKTLKNDLENRPYRYLQKMAKSLSLPSNFKKIYLIDLIFNKKQGLDDEVNRIIVKAKQERIQSSEIRRKSKRKIMQNSGNYLSRRTYSPPITTTPRHSQLLVQCINSRRSLLKRLNETSKFDSNRMLRSCNASVRSVIDVIRADTSGSCMKIVSKQNYFNLPKCTVRLQTSLTVTPVTDHNTYINKSIQPSAKRQRTVSGIYPITPNDVQTNGVSLRREDGTISKINAIVERRTYERKRHTEYPDILNDLEHSKFDNSLFNNNLPNLSVTDSAFSEVNSAIDSSNEMRVDDSLWKYESRLPRISDVFSKFHNRDYTQPLHVIVTESSPLSAYYSTSSILLENFYTFKSNVRSIGLLQKTSSANTTSVYSTSTILSTMAYRKVHPTATPIMHNAYPTYDPENYHNDMNQRFGSSSYSEQAMQQDSLYSEELINSSVSSVDTCHDVDASGTISEMVEDAFEIISQDGDYLERIGMDSTNIQCVLCNWAGPAVIMQYHLRQAHANQTFKRDKSEWNIKYPLGD